MQRKQTTSTPLLFHPRAWGAGIAASALLATSACGGGDDDSNSSDEGTDFDGQELVIWADETQGPIINDAIEAVQADYNIDVEVKEYAEELQESYLAAIEQDEGPDIVVGAPDWAGALVSAGGAEPIFLDDKQRDAINSTAVSAYTVDGQVYGFPYAVENLGLIRNTELAPEQPETFDDLLADAEAAGTDRSLIVPQGKDGDPYHAYPLYSSMGGYLFGYDPSEGFDADDIGIDSQGGIDALEKFAELGADDVLSTSVNHENAFELFTEGDAPYLISGPWAINTVRDAGVDFEVGAIPGFDGQEPAAPFLGAQGFYVNPEGDNKATALDFVTTALMDEEFIDILAVDGNRVPAHLEAAESYTDGNDVAAGFAAAGEDAIPMPNIPAMGAVWEPLGRAIADAVDGASTGEEAAETAAQVVREQVESQKAE
ncbi:sugar ABC transporter substrate-binding protein [Haloglycomyces albus]|uniref:sugar ABC transporter substrate-binding protein n=1 Tax=Haloglycomyces albus TaxID=526067 RepID=UPI00046D79FE|nr:extracellular solute-binding protein [Haloglycomyces albus]